MRVVALRNRLAGQVLAMPIHGDGGQLMLAKGVQLTPAIIQSLKRRGYTRVAVEDDLFSDVEPDDVIQEETRQLTIRVVDAVAKNILRGSPGDLKPVRDAVDAIIADLKENPKACIGLYSLCSFDENTYTHSLNVCVLSLSTADTLGFSLQDMRQVGLGALLHDVGKVLMPKSTLNKAALLTEDEYAVVRTHTTKGWELLQTCYDVGPVVAHAALDHHERLDGSGYPRGLAGDEITEIGRITAVADVYEAMTADRPQRRGILPEAVYSFMLENRGILFDGQMVDAMFRHVALYPTGSILSLWGGYTGVVVRQDPRSNSRPYVRIVSGPGILKAVDISLFEEPELTVNLVLDDYPPETRRIIQGVEIPEEPRAAARSILEEFPELQSADEAKRDKTETY